MKYRDILKTLDRDLQLIEEKYSIEEKKKSKKNQGMRSVKYGADDKPSVTKMDFLPSKVLKKIAKDRETNVNEEEADLNEKKRRKKKPGNPNYYKGTRKSNKSMEREINKCAKKPRPKSCYDYWDADKKYDKASKNESLEELKSLISEVIENELEERKKKKRKSSKLQEEKMKLTRKQLLRIITETILLEGQAENLVVKFPELKPAYDAGIKNPQYLQWIQKRRAGEPVEDIIGVVQTFNSVKQRLKATGMSPDIFTYKTPALLRQALEDLGSSKGAETRRLKDEETTYLGTFGEWIVAMPHTRESSCQLGKGTTWCTAATQSQNLFLSYVGRKGENIVLYYIMKKGGDPRQDPTAKLSVGFVNGEPVLDGKDGHVTVDAQNKGLDQHRLSQILGDQFEPIMTAMEENTSSIEGKHPARKQIEQIAKSKDSSVIEKYTQGMKEEEREDFVVLILNAEPSPQVLAKLSNDESVYIRQDVAKNTAMPPEALANLSDDKDEYVRWGVAINTATPPELLTKLSNDESRYIRQGVAKNTAMSPEALVNLSDDEDESVRLGVASNTATPPEVLANLSNDESAYVRKGVASNKATPPEALAKLSNDENESVIVRVAKNTATPPELLTKLSDDEDDDVREGVASNKATPPELLTKLSNDESVHVIQHVASNTATPPELLTKLSNDESRYIRQGVANNRAAPPELLAKLSNDEDESVRFNVKTNPTFKAYKNSQIQNINEMWLKIAGLIK